MFKISTFNWFKVFSPMAIAASIFLATEAPVKAIPHISISSDRYDSGHYYRRSRVSAPPSLNITPFPGRHIPLPRSSRYNYYPYRHRGRSHYYHHGRKKRHYDRGNVRVIIINPHRKY